MTVVHAPGMRLRRLYPRTRPFRYAGFWLAAAALQLAGSADRTTWQLGAAGGFCCLWPLLADRLRGRCGGSARAHAASADAVFHVGECALAALVFGWASIPVPLAIAAVVCLLAGATALAGWRLLLPSALALGLGAPAGILLAPVVTPASAPAADAVAVALLVGFSLALAHLAFVQAQRLDGQRLALAARSASLERLNGHMQRYLPPSLRDRLARGPEQTGRWERCWLTVAFVDLVGFTELARRLDAEPLAGLIDDYLGVLIPAAEARQGEVSKVMGDGVLVAFGLRDGLDRRAAAAAALTFCQDLPRRLERLAECWQRRGEPLHLSVRVGLASGYCTLGDRGAAGRLDFTLLGTPVNLASRLQDRAAPDTALLDEATAALLAPDPRLGPRERLPVKGLGDQWAQPCELQADPEARPS